MHHVVPDAAAAIRARTERLIESLCTEPVQRRAIVDLLSGPGYVLDPTADCYLGRLALEAYVAARGRRDEVAVDIGTAVELHMEAACFFDDVADGERSMDASELLALAIAVLACGNTLASDVAVRAGNREQAASLATFHQHCLSSSGGQLLDARFQRSRAVSPDEAVEMTSRKSGMLGRSAAGFGARLATDCPETIRLFEELGHDLSTYAQLVDDLRDACPADRAPHDFEQGKKTVPLNYFWRFIDGRADVVRGVKIESRDEFRRQYERSGAALYGAMVAEVFLSRAKASLQQLKARGLPTERLEAMVAQLEGRSRDDGVAATMDRRVSH